jgi:uncharacterized protein YjbK
MPSHSHQEIELKRLLVGDGAADRLVKALGPVAADLTQTNHFFDTSDGRLRRKRHSVRLRDEDGRFFLTAKAPSRGVGGSVSARTEAEAEVEVETAQQILAGTLDPAATLRQRVTDPAFAELWEGLDAAREGRPLQHVGQFQNRRRVVAVVVPPELALRVEVDQTRFPNGRVDEEAEIEIPDAGLAQAVETWLEQQAARAGIETKPSSSKLGRFYAALEEQLSTS